MNTKIRSTDKMPTKDLHQIERHTQTKRYFMQNEINKKTGVAILIPDKINLKQRL